MIELIKQNVIYPLAGRLGTAIAGGLVTYGVSDQHANWVALGVAGLLGVAVDLAGSWVRRRFVIDNTFREVIDGLFPDADTAVVPHEKRDFTGVGGGQ